MHDGGGTEELAHPTYTRCAAAMDVHEEDSCSCHIQAVYMSVSVSGVVTSPHAGCVLCPSRCCAYSRRFGSVVVALWCACVCVVLKRCNPI